MKHFLTYSINPPPHSIANFPYHTTAAENGHASTVLALVDGGVDINRFVANQQGLRVP